jgi:2-polyprenyl-3-methyl-5-hydroxy-6-metoxy-1,4-benzoquinol methylase
MDYKKVYETTFAFPRYSADHHIQYDYILDIIKQYNLQNNKIIDIGSGRGHLINMINNSNIPNMTITSVDLKQFHNYHVNTFIECDLSKEEDRNKLINDNYDILICTDVFEHLDKSFIEDVVIMCAKLSKKCIFGIANHSDIWNGVQLHTIQENDIWWDNLLNKYFYINKKDIMCDNQLYMYVCTSLV